MTLVNRNNSCDILSNEKYTKLYVYNIDDQLEISDELLDDKNLLYVIPNINAENFGDKSFKEEHNAKYAYCAGAMANGIASAKMVIELGKNGFIGSYGAGGCSIDKISEDIDRIQSALNRNQPYMINMLSNRNSDMEMELARLFIKKNIKLVEASAYIKMSEALVYYRLNGIRSLENGEIEIPHKIMAKISREEVLNKFASPPDKKIVSSLLAKGLITDNEASLSERIPMADDITVEADSGGHTDARPLVSILPALISLKNRLQDKYKYQKPIHIGAGGGIGTGLSALGAFELGAEYIVTGSINQSCVEAETSDYVKQLLAEVSMADIAMAPCADMFELGAKVEVLKKKTMYPQNAQKLYEYYIKYKSFDDIPEDDKQKIERRILKNTFDEIWSWTKEYFEKVNPAQIEKAEKNPSFKMALVFRWYLGNSSRWAAAGDLSHSTDMQIWCGQSMGAFNLWTKETPLEKPSYRKVASVAEIIMKTCAYEYMKSMCIRMGAGADMFNENPLDRFIQM